MTKEQINKSVEIRIYDELSEKYRKMIPLEKVYIPVAKEDVE